MDMHNLHHLFLYISVFCCMIEKACSLDPAGTWYGQLLERISALEKRNIELKRIYARYMKLRLQVTGLKNSEDLMHHVIRTDKAQEDQTAQAIKEKAKLLHTETKGLEDAMMTVGDIENFLDKELKIHNEDQKKFKRNVTELSQTMRSDDANLKKMGQEIDDLQTEVKAAGKQTTELKARLSQLTVNALHKADMFDETIRPILKEFRTHQAMMGEAFRVTTEKVLKLELLIPALERKFDQKMYTLEELEKQMANLNKQVVYINNRLDKDKKDIMEFLAPLAQDNVEMRDWANSLKKEIASVKKQAYSIDALVLAEKTAKINLNKEVAILRSSRQILLDKALNVNKGIGHVREVLYMRAIEGPDNHMMSNLLLRQMSVLKSLKRLRTTQGHIADSLNAYKASVLKTDRLMLDRDQRRIREEVELGRLKARLAKVYIKMKLMADRIPLTVMTAIVENQKRNLIRVQHMRHLQAKVRRVLKRYAKKVFTLRAHMKQSLLQEKADKAVLDSLSVRVARLNNRFNKISKVPPGTVGALARLGDLLETERSLTGVTNAYKAHLLSPLDQVRMARMYARQQAERNFDGNIAAIMATSRRK